MTKQPDLLTAVLVAVLTNMLSFVSESISGCFVYSLPFFVQGFVHIPLLAFSHFVFTMNAVMQSQKMLQSSQFSSFISNDFISFMQLSSHFIIGGPCSLELLRKGTSENGKSETLCNYNNSQLNNEIEYSLISLCFL